MRVESPQLTPSRWLATPRPSRSEPRCSRTESRENRRIEATQYVRCHIQPAPDAAHRQFQPPASSQSTRSQQCNSPSVLADGTCTPPADGFAEMTTACARRRWIVGAAVARWLWRSSPSPRPGRSVGANNHSPLCRRLPPHKQVPPKPSLVVVGPDVFGLQPGLGQQAQPRRHREQPAGMPVGLHL